MAKALGLTIPPPLLVRADWVIEYVISAALAFERREIGHALQLLGAHHALEVEIDHDEIGVGADRDGALLRIGAVDARRAAGGALDQHVQRNAAQPAVVQQRRQMGSERGQPGARAVQAGLRPLGRPHARGVVGADRVDRAVQNAFPQRGLMLGDARCGRVGAEGRRIGRRGRGLTRPYRGSAAVRSDIDRRKTSATCMLCCRSHSSSNGVKGFDTKFMSRLGAL
jgi:hypothetical protein